MTRRRGTRDRHTALPYVLQHMAHDHERLTRAGYKLDEFLHVSHDRGRDLARFSAVWRKPAPEIGPDARRIYTCHQTIDTFTLAPVP